MKKVSYMLAMLALCGCAATGQPYSASAIPPVSNGKAQLVVYRPSSMFYVAVNPSLSLNGVEKCNLPNASFVVLETPPSQATVSAESLGMAASKLTFIPTAGRHYVRLQPNKDKIVGGALGGVIGTAAQDTVSDDKGLWRIREVDKQTASAELVDAKQSMDCK